MVLRGQVRAAHSPVVSRIETTVTPTTTPTTTPTGTPDPEAAAVLLKTAQDAFTAADAALRAGDLSEYQKQVDIARTALNEAMTKLNR